MKSKYFKIHELVPKQMYYKYGENAWRYIDRGMIRDIDHLKEVFNNGTMTINNYHWNGDRQWSGIRTYESMYYSYGSQHTYANAVDIVYSDYSSEEVRQYILSHQDEFDWISRLEEGVAWLHIDGANTEFDYITTFKA